VVGSRVMEISPGAEAKKTSRPSILTGGPEKPRAGRGGTSRKKNGGLGRPGLANQAASDRGD